jgi:hypothetical protein
MPVGLDYVWVAPPGWPAAPAGWRPSPGWAPRDDWPDPPPEWSWWQERLDSTRFLRAWRALIVLLTIWTAGNAAMAVGLWHQAAVTRRFWLDPASPGSDLHNPLALVVGGSLLLMIGIVIVGIAWLTTFGLRRAGSLNAVVVAALCIAGLVFNGFLLFVGPFASVQWWGRTNIYAWTDQVQLGAADASAATTAGVLLILIAVRRRHRLLTT